MLYKNRGFTLLELMVGIAILGIISAIAMFNASSMLASDRASSFVDEFTRNLKFARAKASSVDQVVTMCPLNNNVCSSNWQLDKVTVFVDVNNNQKLDLPDDTILRTMSTVKSQDKFSQILGTGAISYNGQGRTSSAHRFVYCPKDQVDSNSAFEVTATGKTYNLGKTSYTCGT